jgi:predicted O-methyltransferase YrrM
MRAPTDPNELMKLPRAIRAVRWRLPLELTQLIARLTYKPFDRVFNVREIENFVPERGAEIADTSVTSGQREVLLNALKQTETIPLPIVEVGAWRGATTVGMAAVTDRNIYAIDPFNSYPGAASDMEIMQNRTRAFSHIKHLRLRSGEAAAALSQERFSFIFIDAIHDYINTWFDFLVWEKLLAPGGMIAFHDVDDHVGSNLACRRIRHQRNYIIGGYCPNLVVFKKTA